MATRTLGFFVNKRWLWATSFRLLPIRSQPSGEPFSFACKAVSAMLFFIYVCTYSDIYVYISICFVFCISMCATETDSLYL